MTRKVFFALLFFAATFAVVANAQRFGTTTCDLTPGPCAERYARQGYAPVDYMLNNYGYGYGGYGGYGYYGNGRGMLVSAATGAIAGAITGGLVARAVSRNNQTAYAATPDGRQYYSAPTSSREQKPLDCRKKSNRQACEALAREQDDRQRSAEAEATTQQQTAEKQACLNQLAASSWRLKNASDRFTFYPTVGSGPMVICGEQVVLRPLQTIRIFPPDGQVGGKSSGAGASGERVEFEARVQASNQPGFIGFVLMAPGAPEGGN